MRERQSRVQTSGSIVQCQSKCPFKNLRSRKKKERILSADDDIFYSLLNSLFR